MIFSFLIPLLAFAGDVRVAEVRGSINPGSAEYILQSIASSGSDDILVIKLDTPGGLLASTREIIRGIAESPVPVVVWVTPSGASATSAGALVALSAHAVAMHAGTNIGAAHPVGGSGEDIKGTMGEKVTNDTAALARAQATLRGRNVEAAEQIVTKSQSFSAGEAVQKRVADFQADDLSSLLRQLDGRKMRLGAREITLPSLTGARVAEIAMMPRQRFLHFISDPNISAALLSLGGLAMWAEVSSGFSSIAAGVVGIFCFVLGLVSLQTLPVNTGGAILLCLGFAMLVAEAFIPSHGFLTLGAMASILVGGLFLIDPGAGTMHVSLSLLLPLVAALGCVVGLVGYIFSRDRGRVAEANALVGASARVNTVTDSRSGTAVVNGELWNFESAENARVGNELVVAATQGLKVILKRRS